ncbi:hypothetical protein ACFL47_01855 [Candidatus Latescibacterota bacterium]
MSRLRLSGNCLMELLDRHKDYMPTGGYEVAHDLGRWWDAVLRLEEAIDFEIPNELETSSLKNLQLLTDNPDCLLMNRPDVSWLREKAVFNPHNFRETLFAYGGLIRCRNNTWAYESGLQLVRAMDRCLTADGSFDFTRFGSWGQFPFTQDTSHTEQKRDGWFDGTATSGRSLEALIWFYEVTGEPLAIDVAHRIAEHHLEYSTNAQGTVREDIIDSGNVGHNHSYLGTLRGLLLFGLLTHRQDYVDVVEATYRHGITGQIVKESGWAPHDLGKTRFPNDHGDPVADPASTGDSAQLALWLALEADCVDLLDDVERFVRARIFPAQFTETELHQFPEFESSSRLLGAWAIHGPSHAGKGCTPDVLAAVTHSLCDIYRHICTTTQDGLRINLHFDYEDSNLRITSTRNQRGMLSVLIKRPQSLMIRIPKWAPVSSLIFSVKGKRIPLKRVGTFALISRDLLSEHCTIEMSFDLPERWTEERMPSGRCYRFRWRGDEIVGVSPQDEPLPFYVHMDHTSPTSRDI